jgi:hypothetical protein
MVAGLLESKQQVTREHIRFVAPHVGEHWREVGRTLNLTDGRLEQIEQDHYKEGMKEVFECFSWQDMHADKKCELSFGEHFSHFNLQNCLDITLCLCPQCQHPAHNSMCFLV